MPGTTHARDGTVTRTRAVDAVLTLRDRALTPQGVSEVSVVESFERRFLASAPVADRDLPARSDAPMDGFAFDGRHFDRSRR